MAEIVLSTPDRLKLVVALANAFRRPEDIDLVLEDIGFHVANRPSFTGNPQSVWRDVLHELEQGAVQDGMRGLLLAAVLRYPANEVFGTMARQYVADVDPTEPREGRGGAKPDVADERLRAHMTLRYAGLGDQRKIHVSYEAHPAITGHVFISYVREDSAEVDRLQRALEKADIPVWRDTADLWPGEDWRASIRRAISDDSLVFLACF